jgi:hypothetical protein
MRFSSPTKSRSIQSHFFVKWLAPIGRIVENQSWKEECINVFPETGSSEIEGADNEI